MKLALGTAQFGLSYGIANRMGRMTGDEAAAIVALGRAHGIDVIDTAIGYGDSEARLGAIGIGGCRVVSKLPSTPADIPDVSDWVAASARESIARLGVTRLYGLLLHRPADLLGAYGQRLYDALCRLRDAGLVERIGVSIYDPAELDALHPRFAFDLVQAPFNVLDRRLSESGWLDRLIAMGTEVHTRSVFLQGLLLMSPATRPDWLQQWADLMAAYDRWLAEVGLTALQAALRSVIAHPGVSRVVVGVDTAAQLADIIAATKGPAVDMPHHLSSRDRELLEPSRWPRH